MFETLRLKLKERQYQNEFIIMFLLFGTIYTVIDSLSGGYQVLIQDYGWYLVSLNIFINLVLTTLSAFMMIASTYHMKQTKKEAKGAYVSFFSVIFGIFTYGCTPCVIGALSLIGITFSVAVLPLAGLPYKLISLVILLLGLWWLSYEIKHPRCKIKPNVESHD
jgi:hypothetical protein